MILFVPSTCTSTAALFALLWAMNGSIVSGFVPSPWRTDRAVQCRTNAPLGIGSLPLDHCSAAALRRRLRLWQASNPNSFLDTETLQDIDSSLLPARAIYSQPALYDLAFGYRDYVGEVEFLLQQHAELSHIDNFAAVTDNGDKLRPPLRIVEVAAGPARHALTALSLSQSRINDNGNLHRDTCVHCVDASAEMAAYARDLVARTDERWQRRLGGVASESLLANGFSYQVADMRTMVLPEAIDTAWILLGSLQHLLTNDDVQSCLHCLYAALRPGGTVFIELPHPRELFGMGDCTRNSWKVPLTFQTDDNDDSVEQADGEEDFDPSNDTEEFYSDDDDDDEPDDEDTSPLREGELSIVWGDQGDAFDPVTQVRQFTIAMEWIRSSSNDLDGSGSYIPPSGRIRQVVPLRVFTVPEITALAQWAGFEVAAMYGALEHGVAMNDEESAYRFVCALRKPQP
jgi:SAM-dependent methyltransferase